MNRQRKDEDLMEDEVKGKKDSGGSRPKLDGESQAQIGRMLKAMYDEVAQEPVPDRFRDLLKQLEGKEPSKG